MPISSFSNPIPEIISGLLQGHQLATQMHKQQQDDQAFKTDQILKNQQVHSSEIMQQMHQQDMDSKDQENARTFDRYTNPISNGMVQDRMNATIPGAPGSPGPSPGEAPDVNNLPTNQGPSLPTSYDYMRKADPGRTVDLKNYQGKLIRQGETKTPDQQRDFDVNQKVQEANSFEEAKGKADFARDQALHASQLKLMPNGGIDAPAGIEMYGFQKGQKMTQGDVEKVMKGYDAFNKPTIIPEGGTAVRPPNPFNPTPQAQGGTPPAQNAAQPADPNQTTLSMPGLTLPGQTTPAPQTGAQTGTPTPGGLQVVGQGGPKKLNDQESYVEAAAQAIGKTTKDLTGTEKLKFITQYKHDPAIQAQQQQNHEDSMGMQRAAQAQTAQAHQDTLNAQQRAALDREIALHGKAFDEISKGADAQLDKILDAEKMVSGGAVQQALAIPKVLTAVISGNGSGVRITKSEMDSIAKARGLGGDIEGWFNKLTGKGQLTTQQQAQLQSVLGDVRERIMQKKAIARQASDEVMNAPDRAGVLSAVKRGRDALDGQQGGAKQGNPNPNGYVQGHVYGNLTYLGGDPNNKASWK
jgi:hypothetical protein